MRHTKSDTFAAIRRGFGRAFALPPLRPVATHLYSAIRAAGVVALTAAIFAGTPSSAFADEAKLDALLRVQARELTGRSRVIVQFAAGTDVRAITSQGGLAGPALAGIRAVVAEMPNRRLLALAADPRVKRVMVDRPTFATMERTGAAVGAVAAREQFGLTGRGVGVAVIDSGVTSWHNDLYRSSAHPDRELRRVVHFADFAGGTRTASHARSVDPYGHGTHVAGVIAGNGFDSDGARTGIAPRAKIVALKVLDGNGTGYISDVIAALDYAVAVRSTFNIRVINLSVASGVFESYHTDPLAQAAKRAVQAGIVVVAAAGNLGTNAEGERQWGGITSPGNAPWVLTVGATTHDGTTPRADDRMADFSSKGPTWIDFSAKPDLVAPGVGTESLSDRNSTLYSTYADYLLPGTRYQPYLPYLSLSGTSMAAPVVAGAIALMFEANPALTPNAVKAILQYTAETRREHHPLAQGAGLLNVRGAVRMARFFANPQAGAGLAFDEIAGEQIAWSRHLIWGNYRMTGGVPLPGSNAWALDSTWGARQTPDGEPVVWGANIVWSTEDDDNIVWSTEDDENIVWSTDGDDNIVWSTDGDDNIVWSTEDLDNIVWSTEHADNIVWSTSCDGADCRGVIWTTDNIVWSTDGGDNIVWSTDGDDNIVWSTDGDDNIVWSTDDDNIVWSTETDENIVWSTSTVEPRLWSTPVQESSNQRRAKPGRN